MKGPIAAMLYGAIAIKETGAPFNGELVLAFTADEENGGHYGAEYMAREGLAEADACLIGEPSGMESGLDFLATACRGAICFTLMVKGTQMHSSQSDIRNGVNAGVKLAKVLYRMSEELVIRHEPHPLYPQGITINLAETMSGGVNYCIIPGYMEAKNDIRLLPGMTRDTVMEDLNGFLDKLRREDPDLDVEMVLADGQGWIDGAEIPANHPLVDSILDATDRVLGFKPQIGGLHRGHGRTLLPDHRPDPDHLGLRTGTAEHGPRSQRTGPGGRPYQLGEDLRPSGPRLPAIDDERQACWKGGHSHGCGIGDQPSHGSSSLPKRGHSPYSPTWTKQVGSKRSPRLGRWGQGPSSTALTSPTQHR